MNNINNPFIENKYYDIMGIETYQESPSYHITSKEIITRFDDDMIIIEYNNKKIFQAIMVLLIRIEDPYFKSKKIIIGKNEYNNFSNKNEGEIFECIGFSTFEKNNKITIIPETCEDYRYAKSVLIYEINNNTEDSYELNKELDRWNK